MRQTLALHVIEVLEEPPPGWAGDCGRVDSALLLRVLPAGFDRLPFFVCGPSAMLTALETTLVELGVPAGRIVTERFFNDA